MKKITEIKAADLRRLPLRRAFKVWRALHGLSLVAVGELIGERPDVVSKVGGPHSRVDAVVAELIGWKQVATRTKGEAVAVCTCGHAKPLHDGQYYQEPHGWRTGWCSSRGCPCTRFRSDEGRSRADRLEITTEL